MTISWHKRGPLVSVLAVGVMLLSACGSESTVASNSGSSSIQGAELVAGTNRLPIEEPAVDMAFSGSVGVVAVIEDARFAVYSTMDDGSTWQRSQLVGTDSDSGQTVVTASVSVHQNRLLAAAIVCFGDLNSEGGCQNRSDVLRLWERVEDSDGWEQFGQKDGVRLEAVSPDLVGSELVFSGNGSALFTYRARQVAQTGVVELDRDGSVVRNDQVGGVVDLVCGRGDQGWLLARVNPPVGAPLEDTSSAAEPGGPAGADDTGEAPVDELRNEVAVLPGGNEPLRVERTISSGPAFCGEQNVLNVTQDGAVSGQRGTLDTSGLARPSGAPYPCSSPAGSGGGVLVLDPPSASREALWPGSGGFRSTGVTPEEGAIRACTVDGNGRLLVLNQVPAKSPGGSASTTLVAYP